MTKTKTRLRKALVSLLDETTFADMTVTELCRKADVSRITFYAHYHDKADLAEDLFDSMIGEARSIFYERESADNRDEDPVIGYRNLLDAVFDSHLGYYDFFRHTSQDENPSLHSALYRHLVGHVSHYIDHHEYMRSPAYSPKQLATFICGGIWSFVEESQAEQRPLEEIRVQAQGLLAGLLESDMLGFRGSEGKHGSACSGNLRRAIEESK